MRVGLLVTCVNDAVYPRTGRAVVALLERLGVEVVFPEEQSCCGQPQYNTGYHREAEPLLRRTVAAFAGCDYVVVPSGSCAAMVRDHYPRLDAARSAALVERTFELSEFLVDVLGVVDVGAYYPHRVTYHPTCHGLRALRLGDRPRRLLAEVAGLTWEELPQAEECCGFGGTFAVKNPAVSTAMGRDKVVRVESTGADVLCAVDNSCLMHLGGLMARRGSGVRPVHLAEILASTRKEQW